MVIVFAPFKLARYDAHEGDTVAVLGVEIGVDLKDEAGHLRLLRLYEALVALTALWGRSYVYEGIEHLLYAEAIDSRAEEDGGEIALQVFLPVERIIDALYHLYVFTELVCVGLAAVLVYVGVIEIADGYYVICHAGGRGFEEVEALIGEVVDTLEEAATVDRPGERAGADVQLLLHLIQQVKGVAALAVQLVYEDDDRRLAHGTDLHEFAGLLLYALDRVYYDDHRVYGGEGAVGVLGEVLVAGGIENIDQLVAVVEGHDRGSHGDTPLLLYLHKVGGGALLDLIALDGAGGLDGPAKEEELLGQGRLAGIGVGYDAKGLALM